MTSWAQETIARRLRFQAEACASLGSPLYRSLLEAAAEDVLRAGPAWEVLRGREGEPGRSALALRLMGGAHRIVLEGRAPGLAAHFPSAGGRLGVETAWEPFRDALEEHRGELRERLSDSVQTNEVGRAAALLGGFLLVARETRLPLRLLEVGASAGLNLRWDHFHYQDGTSEWGDRDSPVRLHGLLAAGRPPFEVRARVVGRLGCDLRPLNPKHEPDRLTLLSYVWADQSDRLARLRAAFTIAGRVAAPVERAEAGDWMLERVSRPSSGAATVVYHSLLMQYLDDGQRKRFEAALAAGAATASTTAPFAWLRMEPVPGTFEVRLTLWPGGEDRLLATAAAHGAGVHWLA